MGCSQKRTSAYQLKHVGRTYGLLTVIKATHQVVDRQSSVICRCKCGSVRPYPLTQIKRGSIKSCGCLRYTTQTKHGLAHTKEYRIWAGMLTRCNNKKRGNWAHYGGRGITVTRRWLKFENFYKDMGPRPSKKHSLERKDNDKGYCASNCKWALLAEQRRNTRHNVRLTFKGKTQILADWAKELGITSTMIKYRLARNFPIEKVLTSIKFKTNGEPR